MTAAYKRHTDMFYVTGQMAVADVVQAATLGFEQIINNRPDNEEADQPTGAEIKIAAQAAGLTYRAIPIIPSVFAMADLEATRKALVDNKKTLAFCRTGTRSTIMWAMYQAQLGQDVANIIAHALKAGYDLRGQKPMLESLMPHGV